MIDAITNAYDAYVNTRAQLLAINMNVNSHYINKQKSQIISNLDQQLNQKIEVLEIPYLNVVMSNSLYYFHSYAIVLNF